MLEKIPLEPTLKRMNVQSLFMSPKDLFLSIGCVAVPWLFKFYIQNFDWLRNFLDLLQFEKFPDWVSTALWKNNICSLLLLDFTFKTGKLWSICIHIIKFFDYLPKFDFCNKLFNWKGGPDLSPTILKFYMPLYYYIEKTTYLYKCAQNKA